MPYCRTWKEDEWWANMTRGFIFTQANPAVVLPGECIRDSSNNVLPQWPEGATADATPLSVKWYCCCTKGHRDFLCKLVNKVSTEKQEKLWVFASWVVLAMSRISLGAERRRSACGERRLSARMWMEGKVRLPTWFCFSSCWWAASLHTATRYSVCVEEETQEL